MNDDDGERYTLEEAAHLLARRDCGLYGHAPEYSDRTVGQAVGRWYCKCGDCFYTPTLAPARQTERSA